MTNLHASALVLDGKGVIIFGPSGTGKTALALELVRSALRDGMTANLVADDRVNVENRDGRLVASAPPALKGLVEIRGSGIHAVPHADMATLDLAVELVREADAERIAPLAPRLVAEAIALPVLVLPMRQLDGAVRAILSHLGLYFPLSGRLNPD